MNRPIVNKEFRETKSVSYQLTSIASHLKALRLCDNGPVIIVGFDYLRNWILELAEKVKSQEEEK